MPARNVASDDPRFLMYQNARGSLLEGGLSYGAQVQQGKLSADEMAAFQGYGWDESRYRIQKRDPYDWMPECHAKWFRKIDAWLREFDRGT